MKSTSNTIPKTQAYALIGGTLLLVICAGALLIGWRLGLLATADDRPQTAEVNISEVSSAPVDNAVLLQRLEQCRPECAGVNLAHIDLWQNPLGLNAVNLQGANLSGANLPHHALGGDLSGANLAQANLSGADLTGAKLDSAVLGEANLTGATMPDGTRHK